MQSQPSHDAIARTYHIVGLMSGTSGDGVDAALIRVEPPKQHPLRPKVKLLAHLTISYDTQLKQKLFPLFDVETARVDVICDMNVKLGELFAHAVVQVAEKAGIPVREIDFIGSHGQTIHHLPPRQGQASGSTLQIGDPAVIAERTGLHVVSNFRARDMAAGGQGAPLVPYADWVLFGGPGERRAIQNIGGIGNVTLLPPSDRADEVMAFDTGPGNMVIDALVRRLTSGQQDADWDGEIALRGLPDEAWIDDLLKHPYFALSPPKSTGREEFGAVYAEQLWLQGNQRGLSGEDIVATATLLTARSIADQYQRFIVRHGALSEVIIGGGGAENPALVGMLAGSLYPIALARHEDYGWPSDAKEAIAFALLAWATWCGAPANLPSVTGARGPRILGCVTWANLGTLTLPTLLR